MATNYTASGMLIEAPGTPFYTLLATAHGIKPNFAQTENTGTHYPKTSPGSQLRTIYHANHNSLHQIPGYCLTLTILLLPAYFRVFPKPSTNLLRPSLHGKKI
jgi:hypothetical protein